MIRAGACVVLVAEDTRRVLFLRGKRGLWELPGGGIERGETPPEAAATELWEETGHVVDSPLVHVGSVQAPGRAYAVYQGAVGVEFLPRLSAEHEAYTWAWPSMPPRPIHQGLYELLVERYGALGSR